MFIIKLMNYLQAKDTEHDTAIATNAADIDALEVNTVGQNIIGSPKM